MDISWYINFYEKLDKKSLNIPLKQFGGRLIITFTKRLRDDSGSRYSAMGPEGMGAMLDESLVG